MYVSRNIEARLCNHCCSEKAISITYSECVFVPLVIQHAMRMRRIILSSWSVRVCHIFQHNLVKARFSENVIGRKICVLISYRNFV